MITNLLTQPGQTEQTDNIYILNARIVHEATDALHAVLQIKREIKFLETELRKIKDAHSINNASPDMLNLQAFLNDCTVHDTDSHVSTSLLYDIYLLYCQYTKLGPAASKGTVSKLLRRANIASPGRHKGGRVLKNIRFSDRVLYLLQHPDESFIINPVTPLP